MKQKIINQFITIRNQVVILDRDIATLLDVETKRLLERCKRNKSLFNFGDYFQLTNDEVDTLWSQIATANKYINISKKSRVLPFCFTKYGVNNLKSLYKKEAKQTIISDILDAFDDNKNKSPFKENELKNGLVTYISDDGQVKFDVKFDDHEPWITQQQLSNLFSKNVRTISEHINNIFDEKELEEIAVIRKFRITGSDKKQYLTTHYNLDVIYSVGYRVKSPRGTQFRQWSNKILRQHHMKGFTIKDRISTDQIQNAQQYFDNRMTNNYNISIGDINIIVKNSPMSIDVDQIDAETMTSLLDELEEKLKGSGLEHYVSEQKKTKTGLQNITENIIHENSWFRKGLTTISEVQDVVDKIIALFSTVS